MYCFRSSDAWSKSDSLNAQGYECKKHKTFKHCLYSIYENTDEIVVVMYDDGNANFNRPY